MSGPDNVATIPFDADAVSVAPVMFSAGSLPRLATTGSVASPTGPFMAAWLTVTAGFSVPP